MGRILKSGDLRALATFVVTLALAGAALIWGGYALGLAVRGFCLASTLCGGA